MPREWHDKYAAGSIADEERRNLYKRIVASKKPYFMRYIYPSLMKEYNEYIKNTGKNALREFQISIDELIGTPESDRTNRQNEFLAYYKSSMPVSNGECVMNKICRIFEDLFDGRLKKNNSNTMFDYRILKNDAEYSQMQYAKIARLYEEYNKRIMSYHTSSLYERVTEWEYNMKLHTMYLDFRRQCDEVCPNKYSLANILLDLCYRKGSTKRFTWVMCGKEIINSLLLRNGNEMSFPVSDRYGDFIYRGNRFRIEKKYVEVIDI